MEARHTPGPWDHRQQYGALKDEIGVANKAIATVWVRQHSGVLGSERAIAPCPEGEANATLIAASPDLLEALAGLLSVAEMTTFSDQFPRECEVARAAISRATAEGE